MRRAARASAVKSWPAGMVLAGAELAGGGRLPRVHRNPVLTPLLDASLVTPSRVQKRVEQVMPAFLDTVLDSRMPPPPPPPPVFLLARESVFLSYLFLRLSSSSSSFSFIRSLRGETVLDGA